MMVLAFYIASADGLMVEQPDNTSNGHAQIELTTPSQTGTSSSHKAAF
jgi:hypothetical protein